MFKQSGSELLFPAKHNFISFASSHLNIPFVQVALPSKQVGISFELTLPHLAIPILPIAESIQRGSESLLFEVHSLIAPTSHDGERLGLEHLVLLSSQNALLGEVNDASVGRLKEIIAVRLIITLIVFI